MGFTAQNIWRGSLGAPSEVIHYKFVPKYRVRYRPMYRPKYRSTYTPRFRPLFKPSWDALIDRRRQQRRAYTREEFSKIISELSEASRKRHEKWAREAKAREELLKARSEYTPVRLIPRYRPVYKPVWRPVYSPRFSRRSYLKARYRCAEDGAAFLWLNDFLSHIKEAHPGYRPLGLPSLST